MLVQVQPDRPFQNSLVAQSAEHPPLKRRVGGAAPKRDSALSGGVEQNSHSGRSRNSIQGRPFHAHVVQCRDNRIRSGPVRVQRQSAIARHHEVRSRFGTAAGAATPAIGTISCLRSPTAETADSKPAKCECNSRRRHHLRLRSSVERVADYESAGRRCESCRRHHFNAPVAQCRGHRFKPGVSVSANLTGSTQLSPV